VPLAESLDASGFYFHNVQFVNAIGDDYVATAAEHKPVFTGCPNCTNTLDYFVVCLGNYQLGGNTTDTDCGYLTKRNIVCAQCAH
jgi:hypothetical protein